MFYSIRFQPWTSSLSRNYILPALFLNPILFLHSLNTILSRILPPIIVHETAIQPSPHSTKGPSAEHPHMDIHASDTLCWSYTIVMVGMQLVAFGRVQMCREERKERLRRKKEGSKSEEPQKIGWGMDGTNDRTCSQPTDMPFANTNMPYSSSPECVNWNLREAKKTSDEPLDDESLCSESDESEIIL